MEIVRWFGSQLARVIRRSKVSLFHSMEGGSRMESTTWYQPKCSSLLYKQELSLVLAEGTKLIALQSVQPLFLQDIVKAQTSENKSK